MIKLSRISCYPDRLRKYHVIIDGEKVDLIGNGETINFDLDHGVHTLRLKIDWCYSNEIEFTYNGEALHFECGSSMSNGRIWIPFISIYYVTIGRNNYVTLNQLDKSSRVQTLL